MISVTSNYLRQKDLAMIRKYSRFVLNKLVRAGVQRKSKITIKILGEQEIKDAADLLDLKKYKAWCTYDGVDENGIKKFTVVLDVKQYLNNEIFDYKDGGVRYKGVIFDDSYYKDEESYYDSPWEIEAYGREYGLYKMFCKMLKQERLSS